MCTTPDGYQKHKKMAETANRFGRAVSELDPARKPILMLQSYQKGEVEDKEQREGKGEESE